MRSKWLETFKDYGFFGTFKEHEGIFKRFKIFWHFLPLTQSKWAETFKKVGPCYVSKDTEDWW